jgi:hypothetical protein
LSADLHESAVTSKSPSVPPVRSVGTSDTSDLTADSANRGLALECQEAGNNEALWKYAPKLLLPLRFVASSFHGTSLLLPVAGALEATHLLDLPPTSHL